MDRNQREWVVDTVFLAITKSWVDLAAVAHVIDAHFLPMRNDALERNIVAELKHRRGLVAHDSETLRKVGEAVIAMIEGMAPEG